MSAIRRSRLKKYWTERNDRYLRVTSSTALIKFSPRLLERLTDQDSLAAYDIFLGRHFTDRLYRLLLLASMGNVYDRLFAYNYPFPVSGDLIKLRATLGDLEGHFFEKHDCYTLRHYGRSVCRAVDRICRQHDPAVATEVSLYRRLHARLLDLRMALSRREPFTTAHCPTIGELRDILPSLVQGFTLCNAPDCPGRKWRPCPACGRFRTPVTASMGMTAWRERGQHLTRLNDQNLMVLADYLEEAGCTCTPLLDHLRLSKHPHRVGCWALDLVLGKRPVSMHLSLDE